MLGSSRGSWLAGGGILLQLRSTRGTGQWELLCAFRCLLCIFSLPVLLSLLFASFAVLLNCPYPDPRGFCHFLSILLPTPAGGRAVEWPPGPLLWAMGQNYNKHDEKEKPKKEPLVLPSCRGTRAVCVGVCHSKEKAGLTWTSLTPEL